MQGTGDIIRKAWKADIVVPAFNVPYLPMVKPIIRATADLDSFAMVESARLEWLKFEAGGPAAVMTEFLKWNDAAHVRIHLDHVPVVDEDGLKADYLSIIKEAIDLGYQSVMVDGSRLNLEANIAATQQVTKLAHAAGIPCEAELGAVLGHEGGPLPPYEELFASGQGFTDVEEAARFVRETGCDWLSVAIGNVHGAVSGALRDRKKITARLALVHLDRLRQATNLPLVLHGGSGLEREAVLAAVQRGIAKVNVGTEIRQAYERALKESGSVASAQDAVYERASWLIRDYFGVAGTSELLSAPETEKTK